MKRELINILTGSLLIMLSCQYSPSQNQDKMPSEKHTNRLINETSPYLLQHAHNPVDWYPWGDEAFEKAKKEDKLVLISIGYAACHWCHVMEHESFEDEEVAKLMNENFVCIKVDREERPDVDHTYMDAVQIMTGHGGWPLNCFALPDGRPVYGGTYFRQDQWISILKQLSDVYRNDKTRVIQSAEELMKGIKQYNLVSVNPQMTDFEEDLLNSSMKKWKPKFDQQEGGNTGAPKFPMPVTYLFLLKYFYYTGDNDVMNQIELSLDKMASGGIYDHLGGGFARYSTDALWKVPHFEKMLYDNAQLVSVYSKAYKLFQKEEYKKVVYESLAFIERELTSVEDTFYSSIDADSEGEEGTFYVWKKKEIDEALGEDAKVFNAIYGISKEGNWEHGNNVLHQYKSVGEVAIELNLSPQDIMVILDRSKKVLFDIRSKRERPITDDKILSSWNALTISAYIDAYRTFGEEAFLEKAIASASYFKNNCLTEEGKVLRMVRPNANIPGFLDDYSLLAQAFIDLYQSTFDESWLHLAYRIITYSIQHFYDVNSGMFFYSNLNEGGTVTRKTETSDNVIPSSNSIMAKVLYQLYLYYDRKDYLDKAEKMLNNIAPQIEQNGNYYAKWANLFSDFAFHSPEVVFTGNDALKLRQEFDKTYSYALIAGSENESALALIKNRVVKGESLIYVCRNRVCKLPVKTIDEVRKQMNRD